MKLRRALTVALVAPCVAATALATSAAPSQAATARTVLTAHVSASAVSGSLPVGAGITVIETCPVGSDLDRTMSKQIGEFHDPHVKVASREYWPAGIVTRYRVVRPVKGADDLTLALGMVMCRVHVGRHATSVSGRAATDLRIWGPAPSRVDLVNVTLMGVIATAHPEAQLRTTVRGAGVGSSRGSLKHAVKAVQESLNTQFGIGGVIATGTTRRAVPRGSFASMENRYRFRIRL